MPGMFLNCNLLWTCANDARNRALEAVQKHPEARPRDSLVAIILAAASTEAFINELAEKVIIQRDNGSRLLSPQLLAFADALKEVEKAHGSLSLKYLIASLTLSGLMFPKGRNPYQDFAILVDLRNDLMHLKSSDTFIHKEDRQTIVEPPKAIKALQQRGLARKTTDKSVVSWVSMLQTKDMADWACDTSHKIILSDLEMIPDEPQSALDPSWEFKYLFRNS